MKYFAVVLLFVLPSVLAVWKGCGDTCQNSNQCDDALCSKCTANYPADGVCVSGATCNRTCILDSDCERLRYCYACTNGKCSPGNVYPHQCRTCASSGECDQLSNCNQCLMDKTVATGRRCAAGCGGNCKNSYDCGYGTECSHCAESTKKCTKGGGCGSQCGTDADCDQGSLCKTCIDYTCSVPCNAACTKDDECNAPITGCGICKNGLCFPGSKCGSRCLYNRDCGNAGACTMCSTNRCVLPSQCGLSCVSSKECGDGGDCPSCTSGKCTEPQCGSECTSNAQCGRAANCTACTGGKCTAPKCGSMCTVNVDCALAEGGCKTCANGVCKKPSCGSGCIRDTDCKYAGQCTICKNNVCAYPMPDNCGIHHPCTPGNNNECPMDTCSRCDPFTATCRVGGPCGAACIVQTDCDQMGGQCKFCLDICVSQWMFEEGAKKTHGAHHDLKTLTKLEDTRRHKLLRKN